MKNYIAIAAVAVLFSCQKNSTVKTETSITKDSLSQPAKPLLTFDSIRVVDSAEVATNVVASFDKTLLVINGLQKPATDSLYLGHLESRQTLAEYGKESLKNALNTAKQNYFASTKTDASEYTPGFKQTWYDNARQKLISQTEQYLIIGNFGEIYSGGAHGLEFEDYKVVDLKTQKVIALNDIIDVNKADWNKILLKNFASRAGELFEKEKLGPSDNFYFDKNSITFVYGEYEVAPYASGIIHLTVPFADIQDALKPDFKAAVSK